MGLHVAAWQEIPEIDAACRNRPARQDATPFRGGREEIQNGFDCSRVPGFGW